MIRHLLNRLAPAGSFTAHALTMATGTVLAQAIPILVAPLLTRLYPPALFGVLGLYLSLAAILPVLATGRYELAVVLPKRDADGGHLAVLALFLSGAGCALAFLGILLFHDRVVHAVNVPAISDWLAFVPLSALFLSILQILGCWCNRRRHYRRLVTSQVVQQGGMAAATVGVGLAGHVDGGLIVGALIGQAAAALMLGALILYEERPSWRRLHWREIPRVAVEYRQFPLFNMTYSLFGTVSNRFLLMAFALFAYIQEAGYFSLSRSVVFAPVYFLSASLGQVFYREASDAFGTPRLESLTLKLMGVVAGVFTPGFVFLLFWAPTLFELVFGAPWRDAGVFAAAFSPVAYCFLFTSWPERLYEVARKQHLSMMIQVFFDVATLGLLCGLLYGGVRPLVCLLAYTAGACLYHATYLLVIFRVAGFNIRSLGRQAVRASVLAVSCAAAFGGLRACPLDERVQLGLGMATLAAYYSIRGVRWMQEVRALKSP
jgi:O-antigen/teichoic acid export membrane protein